MNLNLQKLKPTYKTYGRFYHNYEHIKNVLTAANPKSNSNLEVAIWYHDIVYDAVGDNEERSAEYFNKIEKHAINEDNRKIITDAILATKDHSIKGVSDTAKALIKADLHDLIDNRKTTRNWYLIREEAKVLMGIPYKDFYQGSIDFMSGLDERMQENARETDSLTESNYFEAIAMGAFRTTVLSKRAYDRNEF